MSFDTHRNKRISLEYTGVDGFNFLAASFTFVPFGIHGTIHPENEPVSRRVATQIVFETLPRNCQQERFGCPSMIRILGVPLSVSRCVFGTRNIVQCVVYVIHCKRLNKVRYARVWSTVL